ncbi:28825_t:CDS:2 [Dentiscutata erythropus]|uniref:28825_t:CDS:1 n=1 Tax=Dentiscutata erythropus TaxID=1348616 RepID=A0A9N9ATS4_9GLOM|nr:28825_t:CDS:2 [Dentiscutata erythropus]
MCGFGDKDRRPIDPPPVIRLLVFTEDGTPVPESSVDHSTMVVVAGLWSKDCKEERILVINPSSVPAQPSSSSSSVMSLNAPMCTRNLMGQCISSAYVLNDHMNKLGIFFIFQDLSVRTEGTFTLKFSFCDIKEQLYQSQNGFTPTRGIIAAEVYSSAFRAYSAKKFPGMTESTALSKAFAKQGIKIPIRKEARYRRANDDLPDQTSESTNPSSVTNMAPDNVPDDVKSDDNDDNIVKKQESSEDDADALSDIVRRENKGKFIAKWRRRSK